MEDQEKKWYNDILLRLRTVVTLYFLKVIEDDSMNFDWRYEFQIRFMLY